MKLLRPLRFAPLAIGLLALAPSCVFAQSSSGEHAAVIENTLPVFDLDFPGGTPAELVAAISKASGQTLNAIIAPEYASRRLPPIFVKGVNAARLFATLSEIKRGPGIQTIDNVYFESRTSFVTNDERPTSRSIWYFSTWGEVPGAPLQTRFFSLAPSLRAGITVDDITTAIRTACELNINATAPALKFHQETQLLIAVGQPAQLDLIASALDALETTLRIRETAQQTAAQDFSAR